MVSQQPQNPARESGLSRFPRQPHATISLDGKLYALVPVGQPANETLAKQFLAVCDLVSEEYGYPFAQLLGFDRPKELAWARQVAYFLCRWATDASYPQLAEFFAGRDHATIIHGVRQVENQRDIGSRDWARVERLMQRLMVEG